MCLLEEMKMGRTHNVGGGGTHTFTTQPKHIFLCSRGTTTTRSKTDPIWSSVVPL